MSEIPRWVSQWVMAVEVTCHYDQVVVLLVYICLEILIEVGKYAIVAWIVYVNEEGRF